MTTQATSATANSNPVVLTPEKKPAAQKKNLLADNLKQPLVNTSDTSAGAAAENSGLIVTVDKFLQSVDELAGYISLVRNRRDMEKRNDFYSAGEVSELLDDDANTKLDALWRVIRVTETKNLAMLLHTLRSLFPDESDQVIALRQMLKQHNIAKAEREWVEQALATLAETENPKRLKSGINVALKARLFAKKLRLSPAVVRDSYRRFIESDESEREIYLHWVLMFGGNRRHMLIDFMERALLADMNANDPGCSEREFGDMLGRLTQIKIIRSSDRLFIECAENDKFTSQFSISEDQWLMFILPLLNEGDLLYQQLEQLAEGVVLRQPTSVKVCFLQKIYHFITEFPDQIYESNEQRQILHQHLVALIEQGYSRELTESRGI